MSDMDRNQLVVVGCITLLVVGGLLYLPIYVARDRNHPNKDAIAICSVLGLFFFPLWLVAIIWAYTAPRRQSPRRPAAPPRRPKGYAGATLLDMPKDYVPGGSSEAFVPLLDEGPGRYRVSGVDRESKMDTSMVVTADSAENAKVKAELEGVIVTKIEFQGRR